MLKPSPSRNQRSKGLKVQRVLQVCLLLALGMWLLYQVKHSHDKKVALDASFGHVSQNVHHRHELLNLGRKDLNPREKTAAENLKHEDEEEKLEEEDEESKLEENEDDGSGVGDDEIDGHDQDKAEEEEPEQFEDLIDEEDREMGEGIEREEGIEKEDLIGDVGLNSKRAVEEHYKGDNAASDVIQNTHIVRTESENGALRLVEEEGHVKNVEKNELEILNKTYSRGEVSDLNLEAGDDGKADKITYLISFGGEEKIGEVSLNIPHDISLYNSSMKAGLNEQEVNRNSVATPVGSPGQNVNDSNVQVADTAQNKHPNETAKDEQSRRIATLPLTGNSDAAERELGDSPVEPESAVPEKIVKLDAASKTEESPASTASITQNADKDMNAKSRAEETDETSEFSTINVNAENIQNELIDSSLYQEDKEDHIALDALPETNPGESNSQNATE